MSETLRIIVLEGDETGQELLEQALRVLDPAVLKVDVELEHYDLSLDNRRRTSNEVVSAAARDYPLGPWRAVRGEAKAALHQALARFVAFLPVEGRERSLAVRLPMPDRGAESSRQSLALTFPDTPTAVNRDRWANLLVHEVFH